MAPQQKRGALGNTISLPDIMSEPTYQLLYSVYANPPVDKAAFGALGIASFFAGRAWLRSVRAETAVDLVHSALPPGILMLMSLFMVAFLLVIPLVEYAMVSVRLRTGHYTEVEGVIEDFTPGDPAGHGAESWTVEQGGRRFHYSYSPFRGFGVGYDHPTPPHGPLHDGAHVRLADVGGHIARLEVAQ
jgi:hypothetical protein